MMNTAISRICVNGKYGGSSLCHENTGDRRVFSALKGWFPSPGHMPGSPSNQEADLWFAEKMLAGGEMPDNPCQSIPVSAWNPSSKQDMVAPNMRI